MESIIPWSYLLLSSDVSSVTSEWWIKTLEHVYYIIYPHTMHASCSENHQIRQLWIFSAVFFIPSANPLCSSCHGFVGCTRGLSSLGEVCMMMFKVLVLSQFCWIHFLLHCLWSSSFYRNDICIFLPFTVMIHWFGLLCHCSWLLQV